MKTWPFVAESVMREERENELLSKAPSLAILTLKDLHFPLLHVGLHRIVRRRDARMSSIWKELTNRL